MHLCDECGFVFNAAFDPALVDYGPDYENTQSHSPAFGDYLDGLVRHLVEYEGVKQCRVVEVGSGKGAFLRKLISYPGAGNLGVGFDPSYQGPESDLGGRVRYSRSLFDETAAQLPADVVVCRHVIEHVHNPVALLRLVRRALEHSARARVYFETPCVEWILHGQVLWDLYYEHCSLFSTRSLATAFARAGFMVTSVRHMFGGQYLWLEARAGAGAGLAGAPRAGLRPLASEFARREQAQLAAWQEMLRARNRRGPVAVWGAGAKGVTFCNLVDPGAQAISCVVDLNPAKQGKFVPGSGHRIVSPGQFAAEAARAVLVLNPNYLPEISADLTSRGSGAEVVDLMRAA